MIIICNGEYTPPEKLGFRPKIYSNGNKLIVGFRQDVQDKIFEGFPKDFCKCPDHIKSLIARAS